MKFGIVTKDKGVVVIKINKMNRLILTNIMMNYFGIVRQVKWYNFKRDMMI